MTEIKGEIHERSEIDDAYYVWVESLGASVKVAYEGDDLHQGQEVTLLCDDDGNYTVKPPEEDTRIDEVEYRMLLRDAKLLEVDAIERSLGITPTTAQILGAYMQGVEHGSA